MHQVEREPDGTYRISGPAKLFSTARRVVEGAIPEAVSSSSYGWMRGALPAPDEEGCYIVEFVGRSNVRVLGYLDRGAHVFKTDHVQDAAFEGDPALQFARVEGAASEPPEGGYVQISGEGGKMASVATYTQKDGRFLLANSWVDLGIESDGPDAATAGLAYEDALARCFLAFVVREELGGASVSECGVEGIDRALRTKPLIKAIRTIISHVHTAERAEGMTPPALARHLARWLEDAPVDKLAESPDSYHLVYTARYSDLYYIVPRADDATDIPHAAIAAVEAALNTYKLTKRKLGGGDAAAAASMAEVAAAAATVRDLDPSTCIGDADWGEFPRFSSRSQAASFDLPVYEDALGEWGWRASFSVMIENVAAPYRTEAEFHGDLKTGEVSVISIAPSSAIMPLSYWDAEAGAWATYAPEERERMARSYAVVSATVILAAAFASSAKIATVNFINAFVRVDEEFLVEPVCRILVTRERFYEDDRYSSVAKDPVAYWLDLGGELLGAVSADGEISSWSDVRDYLEDRVGASGLESRADYPEIADGTLPEGLRAPLGARNIRDMRIAFGSRYRRNAEHLADALVKAGSDLESVRIAKTFQESASDPFDMKALTRVMSALVQGNLDVSDQNAVVNCYLGEDRYMSALVRGQSLLQENPQEALKTVLDVIEETEASGEFVDDLEVVHRGFDSYVSRLVYNLIREGRIDPPSDKFDFGRSDRGKRVELVPDSLYLCYATAAHFLEQSFDGFDRAVELAKRAIVMAPTVVNGYRQLARAYMLVGDAPSAAEVLEAALPICVTPGDVGVVYYQLGYVLWKSGKLEIGALCYLKAAEASPLVSIQAMTELRELMREGNLPVGVRPDIDDGLRQAGIPVAPLPLIVDSVISGAVAATDAGMFAPARDLLAAGLHYRPDDALVNVLRSLADDLSVHD